MNWDTIKQAVDSGRHVTWKPGYTMIRDKHGRYLIKHHSGGSVGLFHLNGTDSDYKPGEFTVWAHV